MRNIGNLGEAKVLAKFVELGIQVYIPFGDGSTADEIDYFALYSSVTDEVYLLPIEKAPTKKFSLRYKEPYNSKSNKAEDFLITKILGIE